MPVKPCAKCNDNLRAPGKAKRVGCMDAAAWFDRERRRQRVVLEDCKTCAYRNGDRCAYFPPREGEQPLTPGRCNYWLPVSAIDPKPAADDQEGGDNDGDHESLEDEEPGEDNEADLVLSIEGAHQIARDYEDHEYEEYDGFRPSVHRDDGRRR